MLRKTELKDLSQVSGFTLQLVDFFFSPSETNYLEDKKNIKYDFHLVSLMHHEYGDSY